MRLITHYLIRVFMSDFDCPPINLLPETYWFSPNSISSIVVRGDDREKYLQGQLTCDVVKLPINHWRYGCLCDAKGKVIANFRILKYTDRFVLLLQKAVADLCLAALGKYAVFSKVDIEAENKCFAVLSNNEHSDTENKVNYPIQSLDSIDMLTFYGSKQTLVIADSESDLNTILVDKSPRLAPDVWLLSEYLRGVTVFSSAETSEFVPQMLNLEKIDAISFDKGCYIGQETVARMEYLGRNKRALYHLVGTSEALQLDSVIEKQVGENWRRAGVITSFYRDSKNGVVIQCVLPSDIESNAQLRIKGDENSHFTIYPA